MTDPKLKTKDAWTSWRNKPYASGDDQRKKQAEAFEAMNTFVRKHGGAIVSPPGKVLPIEAPKGSALPNELRELGYIVAEHGTVTRVTGAPSVSARTERLHP
jgi:hypothetical protein